VFGAVVGAESAGEQAVAVGDVHFIPGMTAGGADGARHDLAPRVDVPARVADNGRLSGGAAGGMNARHLLHGHGEHAERVVPPQIGFRCERKSRQVGQAVQVRRMHTVLVERCPVEAGILVGVLQAPAQPFQLHAAQLIGVSGLDGFQARAQLTHGHKRYSVNWT
jgi:hypothetical protein